MIVGHFFFTTQIIARRFDEMRALRDSNPDGLVQKHENTEPEKSSSEDRPQTGDDVMHI